VSDALVEEVKRIIKDSEILKYALGLPDKKNTGAISSCSFLLFGMSAPAHFLCG
jgi:hypothetical protein